MENRTTPNAFDAADFVSDRTFRAIIGVHCVITLCADPATTTLRLELDTSLLDWQLRRKRLASQSGHQAVNAFEIVDKKRMSNVGGH
jgi:hypothetical protein